MKQLEFSNNQLLDFEDMNQVTCYKSNDFFNISNVKLPFYTKKELIRYLNSMVPFNVFPYKLFKITDISFCITASGKMVILLATKDDIPVEITLSGDRIELYNLPGTIKVGPGVIYKNDFLDKVNNVLINYFNVLNLIKNTYPNQDIYIGTSNIDDMKSICESETFFQEIKRSRKIK